MGSILKLQFSGNSVTLCKVSAQRWTEKNERTNTAITENIKILPGYSINNIPYNYILHNNNLKMANEFVELT